MKINKLLIFPEIFYIFVAVIMVLSSCKKKGDGQLLPDDEEEPDIEVLQGTITEPLVLYNRFTDPNVLDYRVPSAVTFAAPVTIMPGVMIEMGPGAKITVSTQGTVKCMGTADSNIVITGKQKNPGYWDYVMIHSYDSTNQFNYTVIEYGGGNPNNEASVILNSTSMLKMQNSKLRYSERYGMSLVNPDSRLKDLYNNEFQECGYAPLIINSSQIHCINSNNTFNLQNVYNHIEVVGSNILALETWNKTDVPFYLTGTTGIYADVIIAPGANFIFGPAGRILINELGSLSAIGLETDSIYFNGTQTIAGYWDCILFLSNNPYNEFKYVSVKHGGGYWYWNASIYLHDAYFKISYSTIAHSARWGIYRNGVYTFENGGFNNFFDNAIGPIGP